MQTTTAGAMVPQQRISPDERHDLETLHGELLHEVNEDEAAGHIYEAQVARARAYIISQKLGWSQ
jgi:hypothetical protein